MLGRINKEGTMPAKKVKKAEGAVKTAATEVITSEPKPKKAAAAAKSKKEKSPAANYYVVIDYPQEGETVSGLHYAIRIGASEGGNVEISIDGGDWQQCRNGGGYWWYDWGYFTPGTHKLTARLVDQNGKVLKKSAVRKCQII